MDGGAYIAEDGAQTGFVLPELAGDDELSPFRNNWLEKAIVSEWLEHGSLIGKP
jgi:hypothetical protein